MEKTERKVTKKAAKEDLTLFSEQIRYFARPV